MKKRKEAFSFDDISEQLFKKQKEEIEKMSTIGDDPINQNNKKKTTKKPRKSKKNNDVANSAIQNNQHLFSVLTESEMNNPDVIVANPMSTLYEFETLHGQSNKKSTKELFDESKEERGSLIMTELTKLKKKETSSSPSTKREATGQKYQKKMDPEHGRFSRHDTLENDDKSSRFFQNRRRNLTTKNQIGSECVFRIRTGQHIVSVFGRRRKTTKRHLQKRCPRKRLVDG
jgi:hypothetical protein